MFYRLYSKILHFIIFLSLFFNTQNAFYRYKKDKEKIFNYIENDFLEKEKNINQSMINATLGLKIFLKEHNGKLSNSQLQNIQEILGFNLTVFDNKGRFEIIDDRMITPSFKKFMKTFSKLDVCPEQKEMMRYKLSFKIYPFKPCKTECGENSSAEKFITSWHSDIKKFINPYLPSFNINNILKNYKYIDKNIIKIEILSPNRSIIGHVRYKKNNLNAFDITRKIGKNFDKNLNCDLLDGLNNIDENYYYLLHISFKKNEIIYKLMFIFIIHISIILIIKNIIKLNETIQRTLKKQASQIHHDISSPIQSLDWSINTMIRKQKPIEKKNIEELRHSIEAIKDIITDMYCLHNENKTKTFELEIELLYPIIYSAFSSTRLLFRSNEKNAKKFIIETTKDFNILVKTNRAELRRAFLNLIKNAIESGGNVKITLDKEKENAIIKIKDTGCGISENILKQLLSGNIITQGKLDGQGLGFSYAKQTIEKLGGKITIKSELQKGTEQIITFPLSTEKPSWFVDKLNLEEFKTVVILDDFEGIHKIWKNKIKNKIENQSIQIIHCYNTDDFEDYIKQQTEQNLKETLFFIDYSLQTLLNNGIKLIIKYNLQDKAILITSRYLESSIRNIVSKNNIKMMPKEFIAMIEV